MSLVIVFIGKNGAVMARYMREISFHGEGYLNYVSFFRREILFKYGNFFFLGTPHMAAPQREKSDGF